MSIGGGFKTVGESSSTQVEYKQQLQTFGDQKVKSDYKCGQPEVSDHFICGKSDVFKLSSNLSRDKCRTYIETTMADNGIKALNKAPDNVKGPLAENMKAFKSAGYSDKEVACMAFSVLQKMGYT